MLWVLTATGAGYLLLKRFGAPNGVAYGAALGGVGMAIALAIADPAMRPDLGALVAFAIVGFAISLYWLLLVRLRRAARANMPVKESVAGFVLISKDEGLIADTLGWMERPKGAVFSIAHRNEGGTVDAVGRVTVSGSVAHFSPVWAQGEILCQGLLQEMEREAQAWGATQLRGESVDGALVASAFPDAGFRLVLSPPEAQDGPTIWVKDIS